MNQTRNLGMYLVMPSFWSYIDTLTPCDSICWMTNCSSGISNRLNSD